MDGPVRASEPFDVVIVGGGPAGAATALALTRMGWRVAVMERLIDASCGRVETLPPEVRVPLVALGVWDRFLESRPSASPGAVSAWGGPDLLEADYIVNPFGCGWHVDRREFDALLVGALEHESGRSLRPARVACIARHPSSGWCLEVVVGEERLSFNAKVVVDATGRSARIARILGARRLVQDGLVGLVSSRPACGAPLCEDRRTLVEAVEGGWWYTAPRPAGGVAAMFLTDADLLPRGRGLLIQFWGEQLRLAPHTAARVDKMDLSAGLGVRVRPAESSRLDRSAGEDWLAVGDAASAWDPLSSQGVYRALVTGLEASCALDNLLQGDRQALDAYADRVAADHSAYLEMRSAYYGAERRWPVAPFWRRRHARLSSDRSGGR